MAGSSETLNTSKSPKKRIDLIVKELKEKLQDRKVLLYYPMYLNTFALAYVFEKYNSNIQTRFYNWGDTVPITLDMDLLNEEWDLIYCFTSEDKENYFREIVSEILARKAVTNKYTMSKNHLNGDTTYFEHDIKYSQFFLKYIFIEEKINTKEIHTLAGLIQAPELPGEPYLSKLIGYLLARGYLTIQIDDEVLDETKGLLRKLLHEEYGFKFRLANIHTKGQKLVLKIGTKGGQQSYEERQRIRKGNSFSDKNLIFVIPQNEKYTSQTKLISIYKNKDNLWPDGNEIHGHLTDLCELIFSSKKREQELIFDDKVSHAFLKRNLDYVLSLFTPYTNKYSMDIYHKIKSNSSFLDSLKRYPNVSEEQFSKLIHKYLNTPNSQTVNQLIKFVMEKTDSLQIKDQSDFISCLRDHHLSREAPVKGPSYNMFVNDYDKLSRLLVTKVKQDDQIDDDERIELLEKLTSGLFLLRTIINNPNGINDSKESLTTVWKQFKNELADEIDYLDPALIQLYHSVRIIAEDLKSIIDEVYPDDSKLVLEILGDPDVNEYEYLLSTYVGKKLFSTVQSQSQNQN